jgi:tetratricopeptide (TPR) repeat protein
MYFDEMPSQPKAVDEALGLAWQADRCREREDRERAIDLYKQALEKNQLNVWCMEQLSQIYLDSGDFSAAEDLWRRAGEKLTSRRWFYLAKMAELYEVRGRFRHAENLLKEAVEFDFQNPLIHEAVDKFYKRQEEKWFPLLREVLPWKELERRGKIELPLAATPSIPLKQKDGRETQFEVKVVQGTSVTTDGRLIMVVQISTSGRTTDEMASLRDSQIELARDDVVLSMAIIENVKHVDLGNDVTVPVHLLSDTERNQLEEAESVELASKDFIFYLVRQ